MPRLTPPWRLSVADSGLDLDGVLAASGAAVVLGHIGAGEWRIYRSIVLPLAKPMMITVGVLSFMGNWKEFMMPLIYLSNFRDFPISLGLRMYQQVEGGSFVHYLMAASLVALLPLLLLFFLSQRYISKSLLLTGSKA